MRAWLAPLSEILERGEGGVLVHVVELAGSGPREVGAQMLVTETGLHGTIGGGELEHTAMLRARELLAGGRAGLLRLSLGPELNQCCGGAVTLAFEPFASADRAWLRKLIATAQEPEPVFRTVRIDAEGALRRDWTRGGEGPDYYVAWTTAVTSPLRGGRSSRSAATANFGRGYGETASSPPPETGPAPLAGFDLPSRGRLRRSPVGESGILVAALEVRERVNSPAQALWLFGAGHVGRAVAQALQPLGFAITWIDGRAGFFPGAPLPGVKTLALAMPELAVGEAPGTAIFLVMTHSHPLDEAICEAVLRRGDFAYLGLIGSKTKRARFAKRLREAGIPSAQIARLTCPIGLPDIRSKEPAAIAASVAADLLIRRERQLARSEGGVPHGS